MLAETDLTTHLERMERDGYTVIADAIEPALVDALAADILRLQAELQVRELYTLESRVGPRYG